MIRIIIAASIMMMSSAHAHAMVVNPPAVAIPATCITTLPADSATGSVGSGSPCIPRADASRPAGGLWRTATSNSSCMITWTFGRTFAAPVISIATQDAGAPVMWNITSLSGTAVTLKAYRMRLLPSSLTVLTTLQDYDVTVSTGAPCTGVVAHIGVREQLIP